MILSKFFSCPIFLRDPGANENDVENVISFILPTDTSVVKLFKKIQSVVLREVVQVANRQT